MRARLKQIVLASLPERLLQQLKKHHYLRRLRKQGRNEESEFAVITRLVKTGDHVIDVGANYGVYMKFLSDLVGETGMVYSIEPIPRTFEIISHNVRRLGLKNVQLMNYAFSDSSEEVVMEIPRLATGGENYYMARIVNERSDPSLRQVRIRTATLDSQFAVRPHEITFIKCDVEGHELPCVSGSMQIMRRWRPAWCVEVSGNPDLPGSASWRLFQLFRTEGYAPFWFDGSALRPRQVGDASVNYFFLQPRHADHVSDLCSRGGAQRGSAGS